MRSLLFTFALCASLSAQQLPLSVAVEQEKGFLGDSFRLGAKGENWMIDSIRLWTVPDASPACATGKPGDRIAKLTLHGGLYNPPVPGQAECDCHALVPVTTAPMEKGGSRFSNRSVTLTPDGPLWQIDFKNVAWSVPGGLDVLVALRAETRVDQACPAGMTWTLVARPADPDYRLRFFDKALLPAGFAEPMSPSRQLQIQVKAHKY